MKVEFNSDSQMQIIEDDTIQIYSTDPFVSITLSNIEDQKTSLEYAKTLIQKTIDALADDTETASEQSEE